jgi:YVTN family beta-propeller protein
MHNNNSNRSRALLARGVMTLFVMLAMGLALAVSPAEAAPFAYVANGNDNTVSVIDTGANPPVVVGTPISVGSAPYAVAVTPDGKHVYVTNLDSNTISVLNLTIK